MKKLNAKTTIELKPVSPFDFDSTFHKPDHFPSKDNDWEPGTKWQTMLWKGERLGLVFNWKGTVDKPKMELEVFSESELDSDFLDSLKKEIIYRYNLDLDISEFYEDVSKDKVLKEAIKRFRGMRPMHYGSLYEFLIITIVLQNTAVSRSVSMLQSLFEKYGTLLGFDGKKLWSFWAPDKLAKAEEQQLRDLKVGYRAKYFIEVSKPFASDEIDEFALRKRNKEEQKKRLLDLYGIGPASVGYLMVDVFHHWDYLDHVSPWERKIYTKLFFDRDYKDEVVSEEKMLKYFDEKWGRWKALAVHYIWQDLWWKRKNKETPWLEELIRL